MPSFGVTYTLLKNPFLINWVEYSHNLIQRWLNSFFGTLFSKLMNWNSKTQTSFHKAHTVSLLKTVEKLSRRDTMLYSPVNDSLAGCKSQC